MAPSRPSWRSGFPGAAAASAAPRCRSLLQRPRIVAAGGRDSSPQPSAAPSAGPHCPVLVSVCHLLQKSVCLGNVVRGGRGGGTSGIQCARRACWEGLWSSPHGGCTLAVGCNAPKDSRRCTSEHLGCTAVNLCRDLIVKCCMRPSIVIKVDRLFKGFYRLFFCDEFSIHFILLFQDTVYPLC